MAVGNYFRSLTSFDLLGNLVPGVIVLASVFGVFPSPPVPSRVYEYVLISIAAFVVGEMVQTWAASAVGDRVHFKRTIRRGNDIPGVIPDETTDDLETDETPDDSETSETPSGDEGGAPVAELVEEEPTGDDERQTQAEHWLPRPVWKLLHAFVGPLLGWKFPPRGAEVADKEHAGEAVTYLTVKYNLSVERMPDDVLYRLMSSQIDDVQSPSRAVRFQARRNFTRGVWVASWVTFVTLVVATFLLWWSPRPPAWIERPGYAAYWTPLYQPTLVAAAIVFIFWHLTEQSERNYVQYLFADYAVAVGGFPETIGETEPGDEQNN